jgi:hypothetical protein
MIMNMIMFTAISMLPKFRIAPISAMDDAHSDALYSGQVLLGRPMGVEAGARRGF